MKRTRHACVWKLAERFDALKADAWDARIEADAKAGRLEGEAQRALAEFRAGLTRPLP